ncbi:hypothetical protein BO71DRAFT_396034 [Aspergillus ellipticus CBS 707.79]|uniref:Uncharacterized protein n=1 Tax=Aspergillus ellipticus CBS 707.79 TaxID=1448320 RepID=A0A319DJR3_9EURO|nr:hypothetical protein BO71DRAFT_396034 [Aspergillus ellipticus CBS 707.79]
MYYLPTHPVPNKPIYNSPPPPRYPEPKTLLTPIKTNPGHTQVFPPIYKAGGGKDDAWIQQRLDHVMLC